METWFCKLLNTAVNKLNNVNVRLFISFIFMLAFRLGRVGGDSSAGSTPRRDQGRSEIQLLHVGLGGPLGRCPVDLNLSTSCSVFPLTCSIHCLGFVERRHRAYSAVVQLFRKRSHIIIMYFLPADTKSIVQTHTFCTNLVNKNRQNGTFYNSVEGWITAVKPVSNIQRIKYAEKADD